MKIYMKLFLVTMAVLLTLAPETAANQSRSQNREKGRQERRIYRDICKKTISWLSDGNDLDGVECDKLADSLLSLEEPGVTSYFIAAQIANLREKPKKAISILEELINKYPDEKAGFMTYPVKIVGRFWIATIAKQSGDITMAKNVYESLLSILSNSENETVVRYKGDLMTICNLYSAEIESLHLKKNDLALARLENIQQFKESSEQLHTGDTYKNWAKYQHTMLSKGKTQASQQIAAYHESVPYFTAAQLALNGMMGTPLSNYSSDKRVVIISDVLFNRVINNRKHPIDRQMALIVNGFDEQYRKNFAKAEKHFSALFQEDSYFSPLAGIYLSHCKKERGKDSEADSILTEVITRYPGFDSMVTRIKKTWK